MSRDPRIERERARALADALDRADARQGEGGLSALVQTFTDSTYPTTAASTFAVHPASVSGGDTEGDVASFAVDVTRSFLAYNLGTALPPPGTTVVAHERDGVWTFTYNCCPAAP